jgi:hypothetical protein
MTPMNEVFQFIEGVGIIWASSRRGPESVCVGGQVIGVDRKVGLGVWASLRSGPKSGDKLWELTGK